MEPQRAEIARWSTLIGAAAGPVLLLLALGALTAPIAGAHSGPVLLAPPPPPPLTVSQPVANVSPVDVGVPFNLTVTVSGGSGNASKWSYTWHSLPTGCATANRSTLNCTPTAAGAWNVNASVHDAKTGQTAYSPNLAVSVNVLPTISSFSVSKPKVAVGTNIWFNVSAAGGTAPLTFLFTGLPLGCSGNTSSIACAPDKAGVYNTTVTISDFLGVTSNKMNVTVTVTAATTGTSGGTAAIGTTDWAIVIGIVVIGGIVVAALLLQARKEQRATFAAVPSVPPSGPGGGSGGGGPPGGAPPGGPPT